MTEHRIDVVCLGRSSIDLYGEQIGTPLEDVQTFAKSVGGCPTNIAVGAARLGLRSGVITRVGAEQLGTFIIETLEKEGVDTSQVSRDPERLTALVILAIRDDNQFPHIFYRPDCADMALRPENIDKDFIASAKALVVTGTHFSTPGVAAASRAAMAYAKDAGTKIVFDIDYRPVLWGLTGHAAGDNRFVADPDITARLLDIVRDCDLVVGTEEEIHIAGGAQDTLAALREIRRATPATLVLKRGPLGCIVFDSDIPGIVEDGMVAKGRPVHVFNTLGAGDGFMSGFLRGWVRDETLKTCAAFANATGALVVSRNGCAPAMPSWEELRAFLDGAFPGPDLGVDRNLAHLHRATTRSHNWPRVAALAFDHRSQFETLAGDDDTGPQRISAFKDLIARALEAAAPKVDGAGTIIDGRYGAQPLARLTSGGLWIARPIEVPGSRPVHFEHANVGLHLRTWPADHIAKCLVFHHPDDPDALRDAQLCALGELYDACLETGHELLIEVIPPADMKSDWETVPRALQQIYDEDIRPDWWKLPPAADEMSWRAAGDVIRERDPHCRGIVVLGLNAPLADLSKSFAAAKTEPLCKGFAVGRTVFWEAAERWFAGELDDDGAIAEIEARYLKLAASW